MFEVDEARSSGGVGLLVRGVSFRRAFFAKKNSRSANKEVGFTKREDGNRMVQKLAKLPRLTYVLSHTIGNC